MSMEAIEKVKAAEEAARRQKAQAEQTARELKEAARQAGEALLAQVRQEGAAEEQALLAAADQRAARGKTTWPKQWTLSWKGS